MARMPSNWRLFSGFPVLDVVLLMSSCNPPTEVDVV